MRSAPIMDILDPRLLGVAMVITDAGFNQELELWAAPMKGYAARGEILTALDWACFSLPYPIEVHDALGGKTCDGMDVERACIEIAGACEWPVDHLLSYCGLKSFEGYPALALACLVGIRSSGFDNQECYTWRSFSAVRKRQRKEIS